MLEERASRARPGAMARVLKKSAAKRLPPTHPEDPRPPGFDRRVLEKRIRREAALHKAVG